MRQVRILAVDDEPYVRDYIKHVLVRGNFLYSIASNGGEALELLRRETHHVLLTDFMMPGMDGLELAHRAKMICPMIDCVMLTAAGTREVAVEAMRTGFSDYIEKPVRSISEFTISLEQACQRAQMRNEREELLATLQSQNERLEANLKELNEAYRKLQLQEEALKADLMGAQRVQMSLLPRQLPSPKGMEIFGYYKPCEMLGGDFFNAIELESGATAFYVADVSGHGVRAAMVTVIVHECIHFLRGNADGTNILARPEDLLKSINRTLIEESFDFPVHVTMVYAVADRTRGTIRLANAGHPPPLLVCPGAPARRLEAPGLALGIEKDAHYELREWPLPEGASLTMYSDGAVEAVDANDQAFTIERLEKEISGLSGQPARSSCLKLQAMIEKHMGVRSNPDDISILTVTATAHEMPDGKTNVKIVMPESRPETIHEEKTGVEAGWGTSVLVIHADGRLTWQSSPILISLIEKARRAHVDHIWLDLDGCEYMDSTSLGLIHQSSDILVISNVCDTIRHSFEELGILTRLKLTEEEPPQVLMTPQRKQVIGMQEQARVMLATHEALAGISEQNRQKFSGVVEALKHKI